MASKKTTKTVQPPEKDGVYLLKIVLFFLLGCLWVSVGNESVTIPVGLLFGFVLASHDHFQIDKKIEYVVLLFAAILSFLAPIGFVLTLG